MIKFILITCLVCYVIYKFSGVLMRFLLIFLGKRLQKNIQKQYEAQHGVRSQKAGNFTVTYSTHQKHRTSRQSENSGEYVDFEEVQ